MARQQARQSQTMGYLNLGANVLMSGLGILSDENTNHTIDYLNSGLEILRQLRPVSFYYKEDFTDMPDRKHYGFIAQEYQEHMPDATYTLIVLVYFVLIQWS